MPAKVKGFLKGLKYIQHIFESPKETELEIGLPTDVKHVAHIGGAGPSSNTPSWMSEFDSTQLTLPPVNPIGKANESSHKPGSEDGKKAAAPTQDSLLRNKKEVENSPRGPLSTGHGPPLGSPPKRSTKKHHLRKNRAPADSTNQESLNTTAKHNRRHHKSSDPSLNEPSSVSKQSRRKRSLKSKGQDSFDDALATDPGSSSVSGLGQRKGEKVRSKVEEGSEKGNDDRHFLPQAPKSVKAIDSFSLPTRQTKVAWVQGVEAASVSSSMSRLDQNKL